MSAFWNAAEYQPNDTIQKIMSLFDIEYQSNRKNVAGQNRFFKQTEPDTYEANDNLRRIFDRKGFNNVP